MCFFILFLIMTIRHSPVKSEEENEDGGSFSDVAVYPVGSVIFFILLGCLFYYCFCRHRCFPNGFRHLTDEENQQTFHGRPRFFRRFRGRRKFHQNQQVTHSPTNVIIQPVVAISVPLESNSRDPSGNKVEISCPVMDAPPPPYDERHCSTIFTSGNI